MSPFERLRSSTAGRFPRMSGDEPALLPDVLQYPLFSPRERG